MPIDRLIRRDVETLPPDATCEAAARLMDAENTGAVVVAEEGRPLGVVTDRDLFVRVMATNERADKLLLRDVMSEDPIYLSEDRSLAHLIATMRAEGVRRVPVVDADGQLEGLISFDDLIALLADQLSDLVEAVC